MVPTVAFPPGIPFTLHETLVSLVFVTAAVNVCVFPRTRDALVGVTMTLIEVAGAGGGVVAELVAPPPQPNNPVVTARTTKIDAPNPGTLRAPGLRTQLVILRNGPHALRIAGEGPAKN